jgi:hypothetical protein
MDLEDARSLPTHLPDCPAELEGAIATETGEDRNHG